jgi:hypothetical protein
MVLECYVCHALSSTVDNLLFHLRKIHGIHFCGMDVKCGQNSCPRTFTSFSAVKRHLQTAHSELSEDSLCDNLCGPVRDHENNNLCEDEPTIDDETNEYANNESWEEYIKNALVGFVCTLSSKTNMTMSNVFFVVENVKELLTFIVKFCCASVEKLSMSSLDDVSRVNIQTVINSLTPIPSYFDEFNSDYRLTKTLKEKGLFIAPECKVLGTRDDTQSFPDGLTVASTAEDTFQYVPLGQLLATIMDHMNGFKTSSNQPIEEEVGVISEFRHTSTYSEHPVFSKYPDALQIHLFVDAFETANELGSHTAVHKLEGLYLMIRNFPKAVQSKLESIFLVSLWYAADAKKYGYNKLLEPVVSELKQLESDDGLRVVLRGEEKILHGALVLFSADNLGAHSLFGFLESFSAKKFCRLCSGSRDECQEKFLECDFIMRDPDTHDQTVLLLSSVKYDPSATGVKNSCILNELQNFHVTKNFALDCMHDLLEGIIPYELSLVMPVLKQRYKMSNEQLQALINNFSYGPSDLNSKPPFSTVTDIRLKAAEAWCLMRNLPLILGSKINRDDEEWNLLLLLCEITDIIFAPKLSLGLCEYLRYCIEEHHCLFKKLFPNSRLLPKHHFLIHYPTCMAQSGPPCLYWCMRFEGRHSSFKTTAHAVNCFKNICKTLAKRFQMGLAATLIHGKLFSSQTLVGPCTEVVVGDMGDGVGPLISPGLSSSDTVLHAQWVSLGHYKIHAGNCVVCGRNVEYPEFGVVKNIIYLNNQGYLILEKLKTIHFDSHFQSYEVEHTTEVICHGVDKLIDHHPTVLHCIEFEETVHYFTRPRYLIL